ncbi:MAG: hypothetical protein ABIJ47_01360 [Candidatus Bathyarchaeota archaeon]
MTWTTASPLGPSQPVAGVLILAALLALGYALGLLRRVLQMRRPGRVPAEGLEEDREEDEV